MSAPPQPVPAPSARRLRGVAGAVVLGLVGAALLVAWLTASLRQVAAATDAAEAFDREYLQLVVALEELRPNLLGWPLQRSTPDSAAVAARSAALLAAFDTVARRVPTAAARNGPEATAAKATLAALPTATGSVDSAVRALRSWRAAVHATAFAEVRGRARSAQVVSLLLGLAALIATVVWLGASARSTDALAAATATSTALARQSADLERLLQAQAMMARAADTPEETRSTALQAAVDLIGADGAWLAETEGEGVRIVAATGATASYLGEWYPFDGSLTGMVAQTGEAVLVPETAADLRASAQWRTSGELHCLMVVPLREGPVVRGSLGLATAAPGGLEPADLQLLQAVAPSIAHALGRARHWEADRAARRAAEATEHRLRALLDSTTDGVYLFRAERDATGTIADFVIEEANRATAVQAGTPAESLRGQRMLALWPFARENGFFDRAVAVVTHGTHEEVEQRGHRRADRWFRLGFHPAGPDGVLVMAADTTRQRQRREELERVGRATAMARMAGGLAHDLNNILTIMGGELALLRGQVKGPEAHHGLETLARAMGRAVASADRLLAIAGSGGSPGVSIRPSEELVALEAAIREQLPAAVHLEWRIPAELPPVHAPASFLGTALLHLVDNALEAMPEGGRLMVRASLTRLMAPLQDLHGTIPAGEWVVVHVADTGAGIPPDVFPHIFEPFFSTKSLAEHAGLSLPVIRAQLETIGGGIRVVSAPGDGTQVSLFLPVAATEAPSEPALVGVPMASLRVLLVDDEPDLLRLVEGMLTRRGVSVHAAPNAEVALAAFEAAPDAFDVLVTDVVMPGRSGRELADAVRTLRPDFPVVFVSGFAPDPTVRAAAEQDGQAFVRKPFLPEHLLQALVRVTAR